MFTRFNSQQCKYCKYLGSISGLFFFFFAFENLKTKNKTRHQINDMEKRLEQGCPGSEVSSLNKLG